MVSSDSVLFHFSIDLLRKSKESKFEGVKLENRGIGAVQKLYLRKCFDELGALNHDIFVSDQNTLNQKIIKRCYSMEEVFEGQLLNDLKCC